MAITDQGSVLILGAGVSQPFGVPLGGSLIDWIAQRLKVEHDHINRRQDPHYLRSDLISAARNNASFRSAMIYGCMAYRHLVGNDLNIEACNADLARLKRLCELLTDQTSETIDDFIVENPSYSDLSKIAVAIAIFIKCFDVDDRGFKPKPFHARAVGPKGERNWIHLLINIVRQGIRTGAVSEARKISIITFNYDTILEHVLESQFENTERKIGHYSKYIEINHVHGAFGPLEGRSGHPARTILEWAKNIHVVNEADASDVVHTARLKACQLTRTAKEIYSVGFSFAGPNCRRIGFDQIHDRSLADAPARRAIHFCNYDGNIGLTKSAERYQKKLNPAVRVLEDRGTIDRPLSVSAWILSGSLGELPG